MNKIVVCFLVCLGLIIGYQTQYIPERDYKRLLKAMEAAEPGWIDSAVLALQLAEENKYPKTKLKAAVKEALKKERQKMGKDKFNMPSEKLIKAGETVL